MTAVFWTGLAVWLLFAVAPVRYFLGLVPRRRRWGWPQAAAACRRAVQGLLRMSAAAAPGLLVLKGAGGGWH